MRVGIIGHGVVGTSMHGLFPDALIFDPAKGYRDDVDAADVTFICVPTPQADDGSCDTRVVRSVFSEHDLRLPVIRSTVPPGTSRSLGAVFQPEYLGVTPGHRYTSDRDVPFVILGGQRELTEQVANLYRTVLPPETAYHHTGADTAELVKYATNTFLATKVAYVNELYDAAQALSIDFDRLRELWLLDPRIGRSHTAVKREDRGFDGPCFPKDIAAFVTWAEGNGVEVPVTRAAMDGNVALRARLP